ncbi:Hypothetical predicted protein [Pelobates cultripes]|uniref:Uncharacterized protein n=1 Tax=Pelobates cultripes TaxID=61616 RepID=A0AAD1TEN5_PELCU|nr:Hypothetical predicted protein [Pelobates cultripes]
MTFSVALSQDDTQSHTSLSARIAKWKCLPAAISERYCERTSRNRTAGGCYDCGSDCQQRAWTTVPSHVRVNHNTDRDPDLNSHHQTTAPLCYQGEIIMINVQIMEHLLDS